MFVNVKRCAIGNGTNKIEKKQLEIVDRWASKLDENPVRTVDRQYTLEIHATSQAVMLN